MSYDIDIRTIQGIISSAAEDIAFRELPEGFTVHADVWADFDTQCFRVIIVVKDTWSGHWHGETNPFEGSSVDLTTYEILIDMIRCARDRVLLDFLPC